MFSSSGLETRSWVHTAKNIFLKEEDGEERVREREKRKEQLIHWESRHRPDPFVLRMDSNNNSSRPTQCDMKKGMTMNGGTLQRTGAHTAPAFHSCLSPFSSIFCSLPLRRQSGITPFKSIYKKRSSRKRPLAAFSPIWKSCRNGSGANKARI